MKPLWIAGCCCLAVFAGLAASGASAQQQTARESARPAANDAVEIKIGNFKFFPETITVAVGTRLAWINQDDVPHVVIGTAAGSPIKSPPLDTDEKYSVVLTTPGTYKYFCSLHPQMRGTVVVR